MSKYIRVQAYECKTCRQVLLSLFRHDFRECKCGEFADGGFDYARATMGLRPLQFYVKVENKKPIIYGK